MRSLLSLAGVMVVGAWSCHARAESENGPAPVPEASEARVANPIPDAFIRDEQGVRRRLSEFTVGKKTVVVFYLGAACPYCTGHLEDLAGLLPEITAKGGRIVAIGMDSPSRLRKRLPAEDYPFPLLSDSNSAEATRAFGIVFRPSESEIAAYRRHGIDIETESGRTHHLLPHPAIFITDARGVIRFAYVNRNHKGWLDRDDLLKAFDSIT